MSPRKDPWTSPTRPPPRSGHITRFCEAKSLFLGRPYHSLSHVWYTEQDTTTESSFIMPTLPSVLHRASICFCLMTVFLSSLRDSYKRIYVYSNGKVLKSSMWELRCTTLNDL
ncbi:hypothetical protein EDD85DRAFT_939564 [Armillaria nabsnona]|nr:hypothetical protein EDD85DRAFT_939564 [Armillaria nabsnona]